MKRVSQEEAEKLGDELKALVFKRTGLSAAVLQCPREQSEMTPCVVRDGGMCVVLNGFGRPICVGCDTFIRPLIEKEKDALL